MKVTIDHEGGIHSLSFNPHVYVTGYHTSSVILGQDEYAAYLKATIADIVLYHAQEMRQALDAEEAWDSGDHETEPKTDERQTEAWLDAPGREQMSYGGSE